MKPISALLLLFMLVNCATKQPVLSNSSEFYLEEINCPEGGDCVFEVKKNATLLIKQDEFGKYYPEITKGNKLVIKYQFTRDKIENTQDGDYTEYVYLEIDPNEKQIILQDKDLQNVKMLFGRICYCKGSSGYFPVTSGKLFLFNNKNKLDIKTTFEVEKIPQIINKINETIKF